MSHLLMMCHSFLDDSAGFQLRVKLQSGRAAAGPALCLFCSVAMCLGWAAFLHLHKAVLGWVGQTTDLGGGTEASLGSTFFFTQPKGVR